MPGRLPPAVVMPLAVALREVKVQFDLPALGGLGLLLALLLLGDLFDFPLFGHDPFVPLNFMAGAAIKQCIDGFRDFAKRGQSATHQQVGDITPRRKFCRLVRGIRASPPTPSARS
jgi:hypothetical protein